MEKGLVVKTNNNKMTIRMAANEGCQKCGGCAIKDGQALLDMDNTIDAKVGDTVIVENNPTNLLTAASILYLIPVLFLTVGYFLGVAIIQLIGLRGKFAVLIAMVLFGLSFVVISKIDKKIGQSNRLKPVIVKKL